MLCKRERRMCAMLLGVVAASSVCLADAIAFPKISDVTVVQDADETYKITYKLSQAPAIVTVDILTNALAGAGVSIGGENLREVWGDVSRIVGLDHDFSTPYDGVIHWVPYRTAFKDIDLDFAANSVKAAVTAWATNDPPDYVVVRLDTREKDDIADDLKKKYARGSGVRFYPGVDFLPGGLLTNMEYRENKMVLRRVPAAGVEWMMGSVTNKFESSDGRYHDEPFEIPHLVMLTKDYYLGVFEVTVRQQQYMKTDGSGADINHPGYAEFSDYVHIPVSGWSYKTLRSESTTDVSGEPASNTDLYRLRQLTKLDFELPTDAEWEYACRAGLEGTGGYANIDIDWTKDDVTNRLAWTTENGTNVVNGTARRTVHPVGLKEPNVWGFYDMLGNAWEAVRDLNRQGQDYFDSFGVRGVAGYVEPVVDPAVLKVDTPYAPSGSNKRTHLRRGGGVAEAWSSERVSKHANVGVDDGWFGARFRCPASF